VSVAERSPDRPLNGCIQAELRLRKPFCAHISHVEVVFKTNAVEPEHMHELSNYFTDKQAVEVVAVISLFGFLNRWNDTMATTLESAPKRFAADHLASQGWVPGKHE